MNDAEHQNPARYHRQMLLPQIGEKGQRRLHAAHALVVGCGALGCVIADLLARAGIGALTIIDRDVVDLTNLHRQMLFDEHDAEEGIPKAEAARARIARINRDVAVSAHVDDFNHHSAEAYIRRAEPDLILDGLDNFTTRYLLNDLAVKHGLPFIHGGAVGTRGTVLTILPHPACRTAESRSAIRWTAEQATPCLRCVFPDAPAPGSGETCDTAGVLGPLVMMIAARQAAETIKLITGDLNAVGRSLVSLDAWTGRAARLDLTGARDAACPCCGGGDFAFLAGHGAGAATALCGAKAVQIIPPRPDAEASIDPAALARRLAPHGDFTANRFLARGTLSRERGEDDEPIEMTVFPSGRAIIRGTGRPDLARSVYARYIGE